MNTDSPLYAQTPYQSMLVMERAKQEAVRLRREAIDAFWRRLLSAFAPSRSPARPRRSSRQTAVLPST
jgi:hypothetical protein